MSKEAVKRYKAKNIKRVYVEMPNAEYEALKAYTDKNGLAVAGFIRQLIKEKIKEI